jgi:hypothetical protein
VAALVESLEGDIFMSRRFRTSQVVLVAVALLSIVAFDRNASLLNLVAVAGEEPKLVLPSAPPPGRYGDPKEGAKWEEERRKIGVDLSRRKENGPIRCALKVRPGAAARGEPELEVELKNASDNPVTISVHRFLLDNVTFILRHPKDEVVGSFCYRTTHSTIEDGPPVTLKPGQTDVSRIFLSVAAERGFNTLAPGQYSLEAMFHEFFGRTDDGHPMPHAGGGKKDGPLARSKRIPIQVK